MLTEMARRVGMVLQPGLRGVIGTIVGPITAAA